jgi:molybdopterin-guanine dinucleotide biosynthesis protein A
MLAPPYSAVILAGGAARRLGGGDKPLRTLGGKPILQWIIERIQPQVQFLAISANGDPSRFSTYALPILPDQSPDLGPMSGILASLEWTKRTTPNASHVLTLSGDTPFIPLDLVHRLSSAPDIGASDIITASSAGHPHPTIAFWPVSAIEPIKNALSEHKNRRVLDWLSIFTAHAVEWDTQPIDPFFNINTPDDLEEAERRIIP